MDLYLGEGAPVEGTRRGGDIALVGSLDLGVLLAQTKNKGVRVWFLC